MVKRDTSMMRRRFCPCCLSTFALAAVPGWLTPSAAFAQAHGIAELIKAEAARSSIRIHSNVAVLTEPDGTLLVDAGIGVSRAQMPTALDSLGDEPITHLINTHWHFDHTDGNGSVRQAGPGIVAHENTRKHPLATQRFEDWSYDFPAWPPEALLARVFPARDGMRLNRAMLALAHHGPAHTDSDISVRFEEADILHAWDTFWSGVYLFIGYSTGGRTDGMIAAAASNLAAVTNRMVVIAGHGAPAGTRAQLRDFRKMLVDVRANVAALKTRGLSLDGIIAAGPTARMAAYGAISSSARPCSRAWSTTGFEARTHRGWQRRRPRRLTHGVERAASGRASPPQAA